ncbi:9da57377-3b48-429a-beb7-9e76ded3643c [Sclerotinia trifoliorum]|uniref:9da57377-3b48-429a-beb7-9e76ded3643c n=1 Tax=Sclerotinia trifoliorum TaxID=28548 RepID=A0A8H2VLA2_9HELO|nr:9da57377-3b48-429a-beb7-9e76ded3643c [Sclerotinia trifoliorum]
MVLVANILHNVGVMWDGLADDNPEVNKELGKQNEALAKENSDLKELLKANNFSWLTKPGSNMTSTSQSLPASSSGNLPNELQLRILKHALELAHPIIDPGVKILESSATESEHAEQQNFPVQFLRVSKFFNDEGEKLMFRNNEFIFTQVFSLKWFVKTQPDICAELEHLELRIVGKYYNDRDSVDHPDALGRYLTSKLKMDVIKRCPSVNLSWTCLQSYCWRQIFEFLQALQLPGKPTLMQEKTAFKNLRSMVIDLANFTTNLPGPGVGLHKMARENLGQILDEICIQGLPKYSNRALAFE